MFLGALVLPVNRNTQQKSNFFARLRMAAGVALYICPGRPRAAN